VEIKTLADARRFAAEKLVKSPLFATPRLYLDVYGLLPGQAQKVHSHAGSDKVYVVLDGRARVTLGAEEAELGPGEAVLCPAGVAHGVAAAGAEPCALLVATAPPPVQG
jgi:mannose-6-phosphate isomerase-like protein (cupin superfamily)